MTFEGSITKLIRHEKFREKSELDLSQSSLRVGSDIIDSLVISDHTSNLRLLDLSNSFVSDADIHLFCTNGQF